MHELGLALEIRRVCAAAVSSYGPGRIEWVRVAVGELAAVEPDLLRFAWEAVTAGTPDAVSRLDIEWHPARQRCPACAAEKPRRVGAWLPVCPDCGHPLEIEGGDELDVVQLSYVPAATDDAART